MIRFNGKLREKVKCSHVTAVRPCVPGRSHDMASPCLTGAGECGLRIQFRKEHRNTGCTVLKGSCLGINSSQAASAFWILVCSPDRFLLWLSPACLQFIALILLSWLAPADIDAAISFHFLLFLLLESIVRNIIF